MSLTDALRYPLRSTRWTRRWLIGGLLLLAWPLVVPPLLALGYLVRARRELPTLPSWRPLWPLLRDGGRLTVLVLAYGWPALLSVATLPAGALFLGGPWATSWLAPWVLAIAGTLQPVGMVWLLVIFLLWPLLLTRAAAAPSLSQALAPRHLYRLARASVRSLPGLWLRQLAFVPLSLTGLLLALVGYPFTLFWCLLATTGLAAAIDLTPNPLS